jgi:HlyD family secretion protein
MLLKQGGFQRIQILEMQDQLLELNQNLSIIDEQINQLEFQLKDISSTTEQAIEQFSKSLNDAKLQLRYQNVVAPVDGLIFDQQVSKLGVAASAERLLSIVSQKGLYAEVNIPNKDIGYIKVGQVADIRIDAFPFTQFGKLSASIESVGADALLPTQTVPFYSFKAKMKLDSDYLLKNGQKIPLKPGMAITSNLKLGSKPVISLVSDLFVRQLDSVKGIRQSAPGTISDTK